MAKIQELHAVPVTRAGCRLQVLPLLLIALLVVATGYLTLLYHQVYPNIPDSIGYRQAGL